MIAGPSFKKNSRDKKGNLGVMLRENLVAFFHYLGMWWTLVAYKTFGTDVV